MIYRSSIPWLRLLLDAGRSRIERKKKMPIHNKQKASEVPQDRAAEQGAISIIAQNFQTLDMAKWPDDLFLQQKHKIVLEACKSLHAEGCKSDYFALESRIGGKLPDVGGYDGLMAIYAHYPAADAQLALHFRKDLVAARKYRRALQKTTEMQEDIAGMTANLTELAELAVDDEEMQEQTSIKAQCKELLDQLENNTPPEVFPTGISGLDRLIGGGFQRGRVAVFASETSGGKSIALIQTATRALLDGKKPMVFSLEMSATDVISRMVANVSGHPVIPASAKPSKMAVQKWGEAIGRIKDSNAIVFDQIAGVDEIESACRNEHRAGGLDVVVVDYLQLCQSPEGSKAETREQQVSEVVRRLKLLALNLNVCVLTASQLNDKGELRESRSIGHHADYVLHIDHSDDEATIRLMKNRNGERNVFASVRMLGALSRFEDRN